MPSPARATSSTTQAVHWQCYPRTRVTAAAPNSTLAARPTSSPSPRPKEQRRKSWSAAHLLVRRNSLLVLDLRLHVLDRVRALDLEGDRLARQRLDEDLHRR